MRCTKFAAKQRSASHSYFYYSTNPRPKKTSRKSIFTFDHFREESVLELGIFWACKSQQTYILFFLNIFLLSCFFYFITLAHLVSKIVVHVPNNVCYYYKIVFTNILTLFSKTNS